MSIRRKVRFDDPKLEAEIDNLVNSVNDIVKNMKADIEVITEIKVDESAGTFSLSTKSSVIKINDGKIDVSKLPTWKLIKQWS